MYPICILYVSYMYPICIVLCILNVSYMYPICILYNTYPIIRIMMAQPAFCAFPGAVARVNS